MQRVVRSTLVGLLTLAALTACVASPTLGATPTDSSARASSRSPALTRVAAVGPQLPAFAPASSGALSSSLSSEAMAARASIEALTSPTPIAERAWRAAPMGMSRLETDSSWRRRSERLGNDSTRSSRTPTRAPIPFTGLALLAIGMTALAGERLTNRRNGTDYSYPVVAGGKLYAGSLAVISGGFARRGTTATGRIAVGRVKETVDNTDGGSGDLTVEVERGVFLLGNLGTDLVTASEIGTLCYIADDQTVAKTDGAGTRSAAGIVRDVTSAGVWVEIAEDIPAAHITAAMLKDGAGVAALLTAGLGASSAYTKVTNGVQNLLAADAVKDRAVLIVAIVTEAFADAGGTQTTFKIGQTATDDKFAAAAVFTGAALGAVFIFAGTLSATRTLIVTANDAAGAGTGGISVTVLALPTT